MDEKTKYLIAFMVSFILGMIFMYLGLGLTSVQNPACYVVA